MLSLHNKIFLIGTPLHGNLGDQAIAVAELKFLNDNFPDYSIVEVPSPIFSKFKSIFKKFINPKALILVHGGGFLGDTWPKEESMFHDVLNYLPSNHIIVLPQTVFFSNTESGKKQLEEAQDIYKKHQHLTICCRERYSFDFTSKNFPTVHTLLTPDMVLYFTPKESPSKRTDALYCIRHDKEKIDINTHTLDNVTKKMPKRRTDTVVPHDIYPWERDKEIADKLSEFYKAKIVGTDRLHGMIFAYLTKTPCVVYNNANYKIDGVYDSIKSCPYLVRAKAAANELNQMISLPVSAKKTVALQKNFKPIIDSILEALNV